jgi:dienelactone hydrolase
MVWYPGRTDTQETPRITFREYVTTEAPERLFQAYNDALSSRDLDVARRQFAEPADSLFEQLMELRTAAHRNIPPANGRFPLVVHSLGRNDYQAESTVLWEYLASHGYVVAVVPQVGATDDSPRLQFTLEDLELQLRDVDFALAELTREPFVDASRTAVIGHSSGAVVGLLLASNDQNLDALVSLDGSITTTDGRDLLVEANWHPGAVSVPVLNLYAAGKRGIDLTVLDSLRSADRYHVGLGTGRPPFYAVHFDFQNWPIYSLLTGIEDSRGARWRSSATGRDFYLAACRLTRHFLDYVLREDLVAARYIRGEASLPQLEADLVTYRVQPAMSPGR